MGWQDDAVVSTAAKPWERDEIVKGLSQSARNTIAQAGDVAVDTPTIYNTPDQVYRDGQFQQVGPEYRRQEEMQNRLRATPDTSVPAIRAMGNQIVAGAADLGGLMGRTVLAPFSDPAAADEAHRLATTLRGQANIVSEQAMMPTVTKYGSQAVGTLAKVVPLAAGTGGVGVIAEAGLSRSSQALQEAKDAGLSEDKSLNYAARAGTIEAGITTLFQGLGKYIPGLKGLEGMNPTAPFSKEIGKKFVRDLGISTVAELTEEETIALLDSVNQAVSGVDPKATNAENLWQTMKETAAVTLATMGLAKAPSVAEAAMRPIATAGTLRTPEGATQFAAANPDAAASIIANPSRRNIAKQTGTGQRSWADQKRRESLVERLKAGMPPAAPASPEAANVAPPPTETTPEPATAAEVPAAQPVDAAPATETVGPPPPKPGFVRFYHGGVEYEGGKRWLTPDPAYAQGYADKGGGFVHYVDVPENDPRLMKSFDDSGTNVKAPYMSFEADEDIARRLRPLAPQKPTAEPAPQQGPPPVGTRVRVISNSGKDWGESTISGYDDEGRVLFDKAIKTGTKRAMLEGVTLQPLEGAPTPAPQATPTQQAQAEAIPETQQTATPPDVDAPLSPWLQEKIAQDAEVAERIGIANEVEELASQELTAKQIAKRIADSRGMKVSDVTDLVLAVRNKRRIPSMTPPGWQGGVNNQISQEFRDWQKGYRERKSAGEKGTLVSWTDAKGVVRHGVVTNKFGSDLSINDGTADSQRVPASKIRPYEGTVEFAKGDQVELWGKGADAVAKVIERNPDGSYKVLGWNGRSFKSWPWVMKKVGEAKPSEAKQADEPKTAQVPVMITQKMKADLRAKGVSEEQIRNMTPQQAHEELAKVAHDPTKAEPIPAPVEPAKEPWQMRQVEFVDGKIKSPGLHREHVRQAIERGNSVPVEVLADYPDLAKQQNVDPEFDGARTELKKYGVEVEVVDSTTDTHKAAADMAKSLGLKPVFVRFGGKKGFNGYAKGKTILLDADLPTDQQTWYIAGHEIAHSSNVDNEIDVDDATVQKWQNDYLASIPQDNFSYLAYLESNPQNLRREAVAHMIGRFMTDAGFRAELEAGDPTLFQKIVNAVAKFFSGRKMTKEARATLNALKAKKVEAKATKKTATQEAYEAIKESNADFYTTYAEQIEKINADDRDPNIGRSWNSPYGKQTITGTVPGPDLTYEVNTEGKDEVRRYSGSRIEEVIARNEYELTPEYAKEKEEEAETRRLVEERNERARKKKEQEAAEFAQFAKDTGLGAKNAGRAEKTLGVEVRYKGQVLTRKNLIDRMIENGEQVSKDGVEGRRLSTGDNTFLGESSLTKTGMDYAVWKSSKKQAEPTVAAEPVKAEAKRAASKKAQSAADKSTKKVEGMAAGPVGSIAVKERPDVVPDVAKVPNEEVERRMSNAHGLRRRPLLERLTTLLGIAKNKATRANEFLPNTAEWAYENEWFRVLKEISQSEQDETLRTVAAIVDPIGPKQRILFERKLMIDNLIAAYRRGEPLRFGFSSLDEMLAYQTKLNDAIAQVPEIQKALESRKEVVAELVQDLVDNDLLEPEALDNAESYFHHQVLSKYDAAQRSGAGAGRPVVKKYGFQRKRVQGDELSEEYDPNTDWIQAESEWMYEARVALAKKRALEDLEEKRDIRDTLKAKAKKQNMVNLVGGEANYNRIQELRSLIKESQESEDANESDVKKMRAGWIDELTKLDPTYPFRIKIAMHMGRLLRAWKKGEFTAPGFEDVLNAQSGVEDADATSADDLDGQWFRFLNWAASERGDEKEGIAAKGIFKAIGDRNQFIKDELAGQFVTWQDLIPETHSVYQPEPGNYFYQALTLPEQIAEKIQSGLVSELTITPEDVRQVLVMAGPRKQLVLKNELVEQLNALKKYDVPGLVSRAAENVMSMWKRWQLLKPVTNLGYFVRNLLSDVEAAFGADFGIAKHIPQAFNELRDYYQTQAKLGLGNAVKLSMSDGLRAARDYGVLQAGMAANEIPDIAELSVFERFYSPDQKTLGQKLAVPYQRVKELHKFREALARYAAFLRYRELLQSGKLVNYGGAKPDVVKSIKKEMGVDAAAAHLSRNLLGDYGNLTVLGNWLRSKAMPFWSWNEINLKRMPRMIANARLEGKLTGKSSKQKQAVLTGVALMRLGWLAASSAAWNYLLFPDEEDELGEYDRAKVHIVTGRNPDGTIALLRNISAVGDFLEWFGINSIVSLLDNVEAGQMTIDEAIAEAAKDPINKLAQGLGPQFKAPLEIGAGKTIFPDVLNPRTIDREEALAQNLGIRDEYMTVKGSLLGTGQRGKGNYVQRMTGQSVVDPRENALNEVYDLRDRFLKKGGQDVPSGDANFKNMRQAAAQNDAERFAEARALYLKSGKGYSNFESSLKRLDPVAGALNSADEAKFVNEFLTPVQRQRLDVARQHARNLEVWMRRMWQDVGSKTDSPEQQASTRYQVNKSLMNAADTLAEAPPLKIAQRNEWRTRGDDAVKRITAEGTSLGELRTRYWQYLQTELKDPTARQARFNRFTQRLLQALRR